MSGSTTSPFASTTTISDNVDVDPDNEIIDSKDFNFNYLFLLIAVIFVIGILIAVGVTRRKRRKDARLRHNSFNALERDVENYAASAAHTHRGYGAWRYRLGNIGVHRTEEGVDEHGEAPPPYKPDDKPPPHETVSTQTSSSISAETRTNPTGPNALDRPPPDYNNLQHSNIRPPPAVAVTAPSSAMSEVEEDMYRNDASRMRADYHSSLSSRRL